MNLQVELAKSIASLAHQGQFRRDGHTPYISHPASVARRIRAVTVLPYFEAVAWLHDSIEDSNGQVQENLLLTRGIDIEIVNAVVAITKVDGEDYEKYLLRVKSDPYAKLVKIHDMLDNLSDRPSNKQILKYARGLQFLLS
ncbi:MAG: hypothetical protein EBT92_14325 [Planctomycetes bacterium]|nr:hypothetical protein [Planctomycetota bacterium]